MGERLRSIPPVTRGLLRSGITIRVGGGRLTNVGRRAGVPARAIERDWGPVVEEQQLYRKPTGQKPRESLVLHTNKEEIKWETDVIEDFNGQGDLGVIFQILGIDYREVSFNRGLHPRKQDRALFSSRIIYKNKGAFLIFVTGEDFLQVQVVPAKRDSNPLFQEKLDLPRLSTIYDPTSMYIFNNNNLITVGYKKGAK